MVQRKLTKKELEKLGTLSTNDEVMNHIVYCPECNPAYTEISIHVMKQKMLAFISDNNIDKRTPHYKWAKGHLRK